MPTNKCPIPGTDGYGGNMSLPGKHRDVPCIKIGSAEAILRRPRLAPWKLIWVSTKPSLAGKCSDI
jgi:hypothetical protein